MNARLFWSKVDKSGECWEWQGYVSPDGYGRFNSEGAYRTAYRLMVGSIPPGKELDHLCRNRLCVNPAHLELVTKRENWSRGQSFSAINAQLTHCKKGHPFTPENTRVHRYPKHTKRICRKCEALRSRAYQKRRAA